MSALILMFVGGFLFVLAYLFYARWLVHLFGVDRDRETPASRNYDGVDFVPAKNWLVLFGHHFASIAGAAPIIGPVIALSLWGWGPAFIWIVFGTIFFGSVHDFGILAVSVQSEGSSIADISSEVISKRAKVVFSVFLLLSLILVVSVFAFFCAKTFVADPTIVVPSLGLIPVALLIGVLLYKVKMKGIYSEIIALACVAVLLRLGPKLPVDLGEHAFNIWLVVLLVYAFFASVTPVHVLLQPRDYISSFLLFAGILLGFAGLLTRRPEISFPAFTGWSSDVGMLWPMLFVTVACGAISGFHSLIASGTTSKQIHDERYVKRVGYGAMIAEGVVALLALIAVASAFTDQTTLKAFFSKNGAGPVGAFGEGFGFITARITGGYGKFAAIIILNSFILTTLDTATRITRYIAEELFGIKNRFVSTFVVVLIAGLLAATGGWRKIWPVFGASNQLVAALALIVISCWLLIRGKNVYCTVIPAAVMFVTTLAALSFQLFSFIKKGDVILAMLTVILFVTALVMLSESVKVIKKYKNLSSDANTV